MKAEGFFCLCWCWSIALADYASILRPFRAKSLLLEVGKGVALYIERYSPGEGNLIVNGSEDRSEMIRSLSLRKHLPQKEIKVARWAATRNNGGFSAGVHLFPFRTEKLSPAAPMVLG